MGSDTKPKHYSSSNEIKCKINSFQTSILNYINESTLCDFFLTHNFGTRQTKGFGSFYPEIINNDVVKINPSSLTSNSPFWIKVDTVDDQKIFKTIDFFWKWLKSGINYNRGLYEHSILKLFTADNKEFRWEKKRIKEHFLGLESDTDTKLFVRALLGLADSFTYKWVPKSKRKEGQVYSPIDLTINIKPTDSNIQRNPAPFVFAPIKNQSHTMIYILHNEHFYTQLQGAEFKLSVDKISSIKLETEFKRPPKKVFVNTEHDDALEIIKKARNAFK